MGIRHLVLIYFIQTSFLHLVLPSFPEPSPQTTGLRDAFFFFLWRKRIDSEVSDLNSSHMSCGWDFLEIHHDIELREWNEQHCIYVIKLGICLCKLSLN